MLTDTEPTPCPEGSLRPLVVPAEVARDFPGIFRAVWPVIDSTVGAVDLIAQARSDMRDVTTRTRVEAAHRYGRFGFAHASTIPGASGGLAGLVLVYEAPARAAARRAYHRSAA